MAGQNILGNCQSDLESVRTYQTLNIDVSLAGVFTSSVDLPGGGNSNSTTTLNFSRSVSYSRIPYYPAGGGPSGRQINVTQQGCCCPCWYDLRFAGGVVNNWGMTTGVVASVTDVTQSPGNPDTTQHFTVSGGLFADISFKNGVQQVAGPEFRLPCRNTVEEGGNRNLMFLDVDYTNNLFPFSVITSDDWNQSLEVQGGDVFQNADTPGVLSVILATDPCEGMSVSASTIWTASASQGNQTENVTVSCSLSATLT